MTKKTRNWLIALCILVFPFVLFFGFMIFMEEPLPPPASLPNPNGYDDLVKAGKMVKGDYWDYDKASLEKLHGIVLTNAEALALARNALSNQCGVPLQFTKAYLTNHIQDLIAFRGLAQALVCEGRLAEKENRFNEAAKTYADAIHLGNEVAQGGLLVDAMLGIAIQSLGLAQLQTLATNLDAHSCRETIATLETLTTQRQSWAEIVRQENAWSRRTFGLRGQIMKVLYYSRREKNSQRAIDTIKSTEKKQGQLVIDLAARACELEMGKPPVGISDLVPEYLKAVPQDPTTGTNMVLSR